MYASVQPKWARPPSCASLPVRSRFLVSFVVDRRGGAMTGTRAAGLRIIVPPEAVSQPTQVIARFVDKPLPHLLSGDDLAAPVLELAPNFIDFHSPVLLQVQFKPVCVGICIRICTWSRFRTSSRWTAAES